MVHRMRLEMEIFMGYSENAPAAPVMKTVIVSLFFLPNSATDVWVIIRTVTRISRTSVVMQMARINAKSK